MYLFDLELFGFHFLMYIEHNSAESVIYHSSVASLAAQDTKIHSVFIYLYTQLFTRFTHKW